MELVLLLGSQGTFRGLLTLVYENKYLFMNFDEINNTTSSSSVHLLWTDAKG